MIWAHTGMHSGDFEAFAYQMSALLLLHHGQKQMYRGWSRDDCGFAHSLFYSIDLKDEQCTAVKLVKLQTQTWNFKRCNLAEKKYLKCVQACFKKVCVFASQCIWFPVTCSNTSNVESESVCKIQWLFKLINGSFVILQPIPVISYKWLFSKVLSSWLKIDPFGLLQ